MLNKLKLILMTIILLQVCSSLSAELIQFQPVTLAGKSGGFADGRTWDSNNLLGKINVLLYVDPDEMGEVKKLLSILEEKNYDKQKVDIVCIVNTDATIIPAFLIKGKIEKKSQESTNISYVLDFKKNLVDRWSLQDNSANVLVLDENNQNLYQHSSLITNNQIDNILEIIENKLENNQSKVEEK